jgi:hypothetical protein
MNTAKKLIAMVAIVATLAFAPACKKCKDCVAYNPATGQYDGGKTEKCGDDLDDAESAKIPLTDIDAYDCDINID